MYSKSCGRARETDAVIAAMHDVTTVIFDGPDIVEECQAVAALPADDFGSITKMVLAVVKPVSSSSSSSSS